jgi:transcriptional regulator with XRE-family HTH domain
MKDLHPFRGAFLMFRYLNKNRKEIELMNIFARRMRESMKLTGISQSDLTLMTGISKSGISQYISGKYLPKQKYLKLIADALGVDHTWLAGFSDNAPADLLLSPESKREEIELLKVSTNISVDQAARLLGKSNNFVRIGLRRGELPFGSGVKTSSHWTYYINPKRFFEYIGGQEKLYHHNDSMKVKVKVFKKAILKRSKK